MTVVNIHHGDDFDTYIGRHNRLYELPASKWANPYAIDAYHNREMVLGLYYWHIISRPDLYNATAELRGLRLGCWCNPAPCHGHLLDHLAKGRTLPDPDIEWNWQECGFCGAPFLFWRQGIDPLDIYAYARSRDSLFNPNLYTAINGNPIVSNEYVVGCMVCGKVGMYAMSPAQLRTGNLAFAAQRILGEDAKLVEKTQRRKGLTR